MKKWDNLLDVFEALEENDVDYAVLRNFEEITAENGKDAFFVEGHDDIDIICDNPRKAKRVIGGRIEPITGFFYHYKTFVKEKPVRFGIRFVGDGYYDAKWEKDMLRSKIRVNELFYALDDEQYFYSLYYHARVQKRKFSDSYKSRLKKMAEDLGMVVKSEEDFGCLLRTFMIENKYSFSFPLDISIPVYFERTGIDDIEKTGYYCWRLRRLFLKPYHSFRLFMRRHLRIKING